ncbi:hypothetical protein PHJA_002079000 [Phtheirospermum japonicum]|uniref:AT5G11810-like protein n=1 Tax=Phtheirospermum japonicum TaxID=374723 RepID=A0A830CK31_9LAMI|nr:hypothetical protein PHJA_002079000 [Phtheirospermum japonicum]
MADKPSRALVLYGDGLARSISPAQTRLYSFASRASCGFMALPGSPPSEYEDTRVIREFAEILDANKAFENLDTKTLSADKSQAKCVFPSVAERFMGMKAAIITDNLSLKSFGDMLGFQMLQWNELRDKSPSELLKLLGFQEGTILETGFFDLVFVHVEAGKNTDGLEGLELLDHLVGDLLELAQPETDIGSRLHMSVIMSYGATLGDDDLELSISCNKSKNDGEFSSLFPRQSYMVKAGKARENVRQHCPMLLAQYQSAVTRVDMVKSFSFKDFTENGVNLVIPADRFLHEVAFKLWKAPKYGA